MNRTVPPTIVLVLAASLATACEVGDVAQLPAVVIDTHPAPAPGGAAFVGAITGVATNVDTDETTVVLYAETDAFYIQPAAGARTEIDCSGFFSGDTRGGHHYVAILARRAWEPPPAMCDLPPIGGDVLAVARAPERSLLFSGWTLLARNSPFDPIDPGPNYWSDSEDNAWVDAQGELHLKITERPDGLPDCVELRSVEPLGYGRYRIKARSRVDLLPAGVVGALFTYACDWTCSSTICGRHEIDIEFSETLAQPGNAQYVVHPFMSCLRNTFTMQLHGPTTHEFVWMPGSIEFRSWHGHDDVPHPDSVFAAHTYADPGCVPVPAGEDARLSLWVADDTLPGWENTEMILTEFFHETAIGVAGPPGQAPSHSPALDQNVPNPFNPLTAIRYRTTGPGPVTLRIYDRSGRLVRTLLDGVVAPGEHRILWDGISGGGTPAPSGTYFFELRHAGRVVTRKAVLVR